MKRVSLPLYVLAGLAIVSSVRVILFAVGLPYVMDLGAEGGYRSLIIDGFVASADMFAGLHLVILIWYACLLTRPARQYAFAAAFVDGLAFLVTLSPILFADAEIERLEAIFAAQILAIHVLEAAYALVLALSIHHATKAAGRPLRRGYFVAYVMAIGMQLFVHLLAKTVLVGAFEQLSRVPFYTYFIWLLYGAGAVAFLIMVLVAARRLDSRDQRAANF